MTTTRWIVKPQRLGSDTHYLVIGRVAVGSACYNPFRSKGSDPKDNYIWSLHLPGVYKGHHPTLEGAKAATEAALEQWLLKANLAERLPPADKE